MAPYVFLTMHGLFFAWLIWVFYREDKERQVSALRSFPATESDAKRDIPSEQSTSEELQGQHG